MIEGIPVASYGRQAPVAEGVRKSLLPEFDVVHTALDLSAAETELPALFAGEKSTNSSSGLGTNVDRPVDERKVPKYLFFGAGIPTDECDRVKAAISARAPEAKFVSFTAEDVKAAGGQGIDLPIVAQVLKSKFGSLE